ncbi:MAG TPA: ACT domain-containing protein [Actinophytocola sp.]|uniref:ACT domain-containing protein n=1 Tax=Actinophytocola sp. TaxID=1872138 RepID=UPI002DB84E27|nr:ACT domain-containing protein [Actinophytocola sp.]HEU5475050.1 ACT domain-containing protein [Actinophytocola sp.]
MRRLEVDVQPDGYSVARFPAGTALPAGLHGHAAALVSVTSTPDEVSVVCPTELAPPGADQVDHGWRLLTVRGPLEFTLTGIMAAMAGALAAAGVSLFALSTFDTDHVLVKATDLTRAVSALTEAGHEVHVPAG